MTRKDLELMAEAYEQIEEGIFSRAKARVAGVRAGIGGAVERGKGQLQKAAGNAFTKLGAEGGKDFANAGQARVEAGKQAGAKAKRESITASIMQGVIDDLTKLGLDGNADVVNEIKTALEDVLNKLLEPPFADAETTAETAADAADSAPAAVQPSGAREPLAWNTSRF